MFSGQLFKFISLLIPVFPANFGAGPIPLALKLLIRIQSTDFNIKDAYIVPVFSPPTLHATEKVVPTSLENLNLFTKEL
jgi:hypothetical protein